MIDSHCHLDHEPLKGDLHNIIKRAKETGITKLLTICTTIQSFENILLAASLISFMHTRAVGNCTELLTKACI